MFDKLTNKVVSFKKACDISKQSKENNYRKIGTFYQNRSKKNL